MDQGFLFHSFVFLAAACIVVPLTGRFKLGSVLGYLFAGVLIGPYGLGFIENAEEVMKFAEFGVIMMLFMIGLELDPKTLWKLRKLIVGLGGLQVAVTSAVFTAIGIAIGYDWKPSFAVGMAISLSSTALVLQMLEEKNLLQTSAGESSFAVLLFQDLALIPILLILPLLGNGTAAAGAHAGILEGLPGWLHALTVAAVIGLIVLAGRLSHPVFHFIAKTKLREVFTAISLALVIGITLLMEVIGMSPALGAFLAGVVLANSEYRHTLEADIRPFKGLLLGLFFISVGMGMNLTLLAAQPGMLLGATAVLVIIKAALLYGFGRMFGLLDGQNVLFALALAQGSEFAFVLSQYAGMISILTAEQSAALNLAVALSMATTPLLMLVNDRYVIPRFMSHLPEKEYDVIDERHNPVIIAGYGRYGQIIGRFLRAQNIKVTILESDPDQIALLRKFGGVGYFGDATRPELLENAGAAHAKALVVTVDDADECLEIIRLAREHFPNLRVYARARNRRHAYELHKAGVHYFRREMFDSSLIMAQEIATLLGISRDDAKHRAELFQAHDEKTLLESFQFFDKEPELISFTRQASGELERILRDDMTSAPELPRRVTA